MAKNLEWSCEYCDSMNQYNETHCASCGAPRTAKTEFKSTVLPEDEEKKTVNEHLDEGLEALIKINQMTQQTSQILDRIADSVPVVEPLNKITRVKQKINNLQRRIKRTFRVICVVTIILIIVFILSKIIN